MTSGAVASARGPGGEGKGDILAKNLDYTIFEWGPQLGRDPFVVERAKGVHFWDAEGKRYLDFSSQSINVNIGHADERVLGAMAKQAELLPFVSPLLASEPRGLLGERLAALTPEPLTKTFFTLGGAEANENAIRVAKAFTGRPKILSRYRSYHGATNAVLTLSGDPRRWPVEPGVPGTVRFWGPYPYRCRFCGGTGDCAAECLGHLEDVIIHEGPGTIAAIILEPIPGGYGVIVPPAGYLAGVRELCDRYRILLIADEVMTGFGRTGRWFAVDHEQVRPDLMTVAKGLTSGHAPLGALLLSGEIATFFDDRAFPGGLTYNSYPLGCAAALATLDVVVEDGLVENSRRMGEQLMRRLAEVQQAHASVGEVRGVGLFAAIELVRDRETREPLGSIETHSPHQAVMNELKAQLLADGLYPMVRGNMIVIAPPLCIDGEALEEGLHIIDRALRIADEAAVDG